MRDQKITSFEANGKFIVFEDNIRDKKRVRLFLNNVDNSAPVHFYMPLDQAMVLAADMLNSEIASCELEASGGGERYIRINTTVVDEEACHTIRILNSRDGEEVVNAIYIPFSQARSIGAALMLRLLTGL